MVLLNAAAALSAESGDLEAGLGAAETVAQQPGSPGQAGRAGGYFPAGGAGMTILDTIFATKRLEVARRRQERPLAEVRRLADAAAPARDFSAALRRPGPRSAVRLIAEIKRASPSKGLLVQDFDPLRQAPPIRMDGAAAISVLTDERYFQGSLAILTAVAGLHARPPLLRKDFFFDPYQVYRSPRGRGGCHPVDRRRARAGPAGRPASLARELGMAALVEVHNPAELEQALACQAGLVGINNRDLRTFTVSLENCLELRAGIPAGIVTVAESGIHTRADVERLARAGFDAILVGEAPVTAPERRRRDEGAAGMKVKICGITTLDDGWRPWQPGPTCSGSTSTPEARAL